jgi:hypothetical protein
MNPSRFLAALVAVAVLAVAAPVPAQNAPANAAPPSAAPISQDLLDSLLAPVALYPDQLLAQVLMASTYPLEVVQAARFVKANPGLRGPALDDALKDMPWDPSVLSLASFPQVLDMMNDKLDWTQRLGDAFLADEVAVMQTVQGLRARAQQAGNLQSNEQQQVIYQDRTIIIQPAQPQFLFVPVYNPTVIFGPWWAPAYRPWFWFPPPIWGFGPRPPYWGFYAGFYWGTAWGISHNNWGWAQPNWRGHTININVNNTSNVWINRPGYRDRVPSNGNWTHNVDNRRGVAYRDSATSNRYRPNSNLGVQSRENYRGRDNTTRPVPGTVDRPGSGAGNNLARPSPGTVDRPTAGGGNVSRPTSPPTREARPGNTGARPQPGFQPESRPQVQRDANRGAQSRASPQRPPQNPPRSAPSANRPPPSAGREGGGGGGGGGRGAEGRGR